MALPGITIAKPMVLPHYLELCRRQHSRYQRRQGICNHKVRIAGVWERAHRPQLKNAAPPGGLKTAHQLEDRINDPTRDCSPARR
jgi:hypothetical protein